MADSNRDTPGTRAVRRGVRSAEGSDSVTTPLLQDATEDDPQEQVTSPRINNDGDSDPQDETDEPWCPSIRAMLSLFLSPVIDEHGKLPSIVMGLVTIFLCGSLLGFLMPKDPKFPSAVYATVSSCLGYTYFFAWSVSFYPQVVTNYRRKTTAGLSVEFASLNVLGFACYTVYNVTLFFSHSVQEMYRRRYGSESQIPIQSNDVAFAVHALVLASITLYQIVRYDGIHFQNISPYIMALIVTILGVAITGAILSASSTSYMNWLDYVYLLSICKIVVTLVKYVPQVFLNWKRRSTAGWSIWQILLDLMGGLLSNLQLVLDCAALHDFSGITGNVAKLLLGQVSMIFDVVFCLQHYIFYPAARTVLQSHESESFHDAGDEDTPDVINTLT